MHVKNRSSAIRARSTAGHRSKLIGIAAILGLLLGALFTVSWIAPAGAINTKPIQALPGPACSGTYTAYDIPTGGLVSAVVTLQGGGGGGGGGNVGFAGTGTGRGGQGGGGASVSVEIPASAFAGQTKVSLGVGCGGGGGRSSGGPVTGGASPYGAGGQSTGTGTTGGGGGGATAFCIGNATCTTLLAVAAGGGGGGGSYTYSASTNATAATAAIGGPGSKSSGTDGTDGNVGTGYADQGGKPGKGATQTTFGAGGAAGVRAQCIGGTASTTAGGPGGGDGGNCSSGGGGGGGLKGGGGGGGDDAQCWLCAAETGGGGGAGSSYVVSGTPTYSAAGTGSQACGQSADSCTIRTTPGTGGGRANNTNGYGGEAGSASLTWKVAGTTATWNGLGSGLSGVNFATQPLVTVKDYQGTVVATPESITIAATGPTSNALSCTNLTVDTAATTGIATYAGCKVTGKAGVYTFNATTNATTPVSLLTGTGTYTVTSTTTTAVTGCTPSPFGWNTRTSCTVTVSDNQATPGFRVTPTGTVNLASTGDGVGSFSACNLVEQTPGVAGVATCTSNFSATKNDTYSITASYPGSSLHAASGPSAAATASKRSRFTSTSVSCDAGSVPVDTDKRCTATVTDIMAGTKVAPVGTVTFGQSGGGTFFFDTCSLSPISGAVSTCYTDFQSATPGNKTVTASYAGTTSNAPDCTITPTWCEAGVTVSDPTGFRHASSAATPVPVVVTGTAIPTRHSTTSSASCSPNTGPIGVGTTCTVLVTDTFAFGPKVTPIGTATWGQSGGGTYSPSNTCTLVEVIPGESASCSVTFTPTGAVGNKTVNAFYNGNATFFTSGTGSILYVAGPPITPPPPARHDTSTALVCSPTTTPIGVGVNCTATVTDVIAGPSEPTGQVTFGYSGGGTLSPGVCNLVGDGNGSSSSCSTTFTPTGAVGNKTVNAFYNGTAAHRTSGSGSILIVATAPA